MEKRQQKLFIQSPEMLSLLLQNTKISVEIFGMTISPFASFHRLFQSIFSSLYFSFFCPFFLVQICLPNGRIQWNQRFLYWKAAPNPSVWGIQGISPNPWLAPVGWLKECCPLVLTFNKYMGREMLGGFSNLKAIPWSPTSPGIHLQVHQPLHEKSNQL